MEEILLAPGPQLATAPSVPRDPDDRFGWLEERDTPETKQFLKDEEMRFRRYLKSHDSLREHLKTRTRELLSVDAVELPMPDNQGGLLYLCRKNNQEQMHLYHANADGEERCILTPHDCGRSPYLSLAPIMVSDHGRYLVIGVRDGGGDAQEFRFYDFEQGRLLADCLGSGLFRGLVFTSDQDGVYYSVEDEVGTYSRVRAIRKHIFGSPPSEDELLYRAGEEPSLRLLLRGCGDTGDLVYSHVHTRRELETRVVLHRIKKEEEPREVAVRKGGLFSPIVHSDSLDVLSTVGAMKGRVERLDIRSDRAQDWRIVVPEEINRLVRYQRDDRYEVMQYESAEDSYSVVKDLISGDKRQIDYPRDGTVKIGAVDFFHHRIYYSYSAPTVPDLIRFADLDTAEHQTWWTPAVRDLPHICADKTSYSCRDGSRITMTILRSAAQRMPGPLVLNAYGFGSMSPRPRFSVLMTLLIETGFTCAVAHLEDARTTEEGGRVAYEGCKQQKTVDDLLDGAEWLIRSGFTTAESFGLAGQSFGALLMLCAATQRPELFRAVLAVAPLADLRRFHLFGVARGFVATLGSPDNPEDQAWLEVASPYHRLQQRTKYPAMYIVSGHRDLRCDGLHARKFVAKLRYEIQNVRPTVLDYNVVRGHKPVLPLSQRIDGIANRACFLIAELRTSRAEGKTHA